MARRLPPLRPEDLDDAQRTLRARLLDPPGRVEVAADGKLHGPFDAMLRAAGTGAALARSAVRCATPGCCPTGSGSR